MALTLSRVDRTPRTYVLADVMATVPASVDGVQVALLPPRSGPTAATVWTTVTYASGSFDVLWVGPDADATGGLVVSASADAWVKVTDAPLVEAVKIERITVLGGGSFQTFATVQALIGLDTDGTPFYDPSGIGTPASLVLDTDGVLYFTP